MIIVIVIAFLVLWFFLPVFRVAVKNLPFVIFYYIKDTINYIRSQGWKYGKGLYGITIFVGMFGCGKTLSMVHRIRKIYNVYGDRVRILSNIDLVDIPYIKLVNFNQIVELQKECTDYDLTVVVIDEIEHVLSHRNYAKFPLAMLGTITQQRKLKPPVYMLCTAQRFFMVDKLFRSLCTDVVDCNKYWRFVRNNVYDAWDVESKSSFDNCKLKSSLYWFVHDDDYYSYDTLDLVTSSSSDDFISNDEALINKGLDFVDRQVALNHSDTHRNRFRLRRIRRR